MFSSYGMSYAVIPSLGGPPNARLHSFLRHRLDRDSDRLDDWRTLRGAVMGATEYQITDAEREKRIETLGAAMVLATDLTERARLWRRLRTEILARSENQIARMEARMGLAQGGR